MELIITNFLYVILVCFSFMQKTMATTFVHIDSKINFLVQEQILKSYLLKYPDESLRFINHEIRQRSGDRLLMLKLLKGDKISLIFKGSYLEKKYNPGEHQKDIVNKSMISSCLDWQCLCHDLISLSALHLDCSPRFSLKTPVPLIVSPKALLVDHRVEDTPIAAVSEPALPEPLTLSNNTYDLILSGGLKKGGFLPKKYDSLPVDSAPPELGAELGVSFNKGHQFSFYGGYANSFANSVRVFSKRELMMIYRYKWPIGFYRLALFSGTSFKSIRMAIQASPEEVGHFLDFQIGVVYRHFLRFTLASDIGPINQLSAEYQGAKLSPYAMISLGLGL